MKKATRKVEFHSLIEVERFFFPKGYEEKKREEAVDANLPTAPRGSTLANKLLETIKRELR